MLIELELLRFGESWMASTIPSKNDSTNPSQTPSGDKKPAKKPGDAPPIKTARSLGASTGPGGAGLSSKAIGNLARPTTGTATPTSRLSGPGLAYTPGSSHATSVANIPTNVGANAPKKLNFKAKVIARSEPLE